VDESENKERNLLGWGATAAHNGRCLANTVDEVLLIVIEANLKRWSIDDKNTIHLDDFQREMSQKQIIEEYV
jgi:hypothetical protein